MLKKAILAGMLLSCTVISYAQQTLSIIKPDAISSHKLGQIIADIEANHLNVIAIKMLRLSQEQAGAFYEMHKDKPFYPELVKFMTSGPIVVQVLEGEDAIQRYRDLMGNTDPNLAPKTSLRAKYAESKQRNAVHGSDSKESAEREISFFFTTDELFSR